MLRKYFVLVFLVLSFWGCTDQLSVPIGKEGLLISTKGTLSPVAASEEALNEFLKANAANDRTSQIQLMAVGLIFTVDNGTRVLVIDRGSEPSKRKIRILEGEMKGRSGYVPYEWIRPIS